jgi:uncharacterized protein YoxC
MKLAITLFAVCGLLAFQAVAADPNPTPMATGVKSQVQQLIDEARSLEQKAGQIAQTLKNKKADPSSLSGHFAEVASGVEKIQNLVSQLESQTSSMNARQMAEFNRVKELASLMGVFLSNKKNLLESGDLSSKREELRANALSVAIRAELIRKNAAKLNV